jgi:predicted AlkP superfamily phosphohydrolase/phosphomutase
MSRSVILLEFNELSPTLMNRFISQGHLPNFKRFSEESSVYLTEAEERAPYLDPWIQWITVHTGKNFKEHGVERLNEGHTITDKRVWDLVAENGDPVWICGSMNVGYRPGIKGVVMPDPWTTHVQPTPKELMPYFSFIQRNVLEYTNERVPLSRADYVQFVKFMVQHGLSATTVAAVVKQLLKETRGQDRWKRAVILDKLQFDVFSWYFRKIKPRFSTFFLNSTAHYQHFYWRNMEPEIFTIQLSPDEAAKYESAILFGYQEMDRLVAKFIDLAGKDATLVFCTAISQQPYLAYEEKGGRQVYRPSNFEALVKFAGVGGPFKVAPVMAHQFHVYLETEAAAQRAEQQLKALTVNGRQAMAVIRTGLQIFSGCHVYDNLPNTQMLLGEGGTSARFFDFFYKIDGLKSGMHHPDGMLWIREPARSHSYHGEKVPLAAVAPTLLELLGIEKPASMSEPSVFDVSERVAQPA